MARKFTYDETKVKELRMEVIEASLAVMRDDPKVEKWSAYKKDMILKIAPRVLPVLNEVTGKDGKELPVPIFNVQTNNSNEQDNQPKEAN